MPVLISTVFERKEYNHLARFSPPPNSLLPPLLLLSIPSSSSASQHLSWHCFFYPIALFWFDFFLTISRFYRPGFHTLLFLKIVIEPKLDLVS